MNRKEVRYRLISTLLQASGPLTLEELVAQCELSEEEVRPVLWELVAENLVVEGELVPEVPGPQYRWAARWAQEEGRRAASSQRELQAVVKAAATVQEEKPDLDSDSVLAFHDYVIHEYVPPKDKRTLVFLQCSVKRPFSSSPSHASMRRAIWVATGYDPRKDFERCPVHVVVLASKIGPVPYELEDVYPANVRGGGVKHFSSSHYARVKPILAERMAQYIIAHRASYDHTTTFTEGRYAQVMREARKIAVERCGKAANFPILPGLDGPRVTWMGDSRPQRYWQKYWVQLYLEIAVWLDPEARARAEERLRELDVSYR